ncbi:MAG: hypothetical protein VZS44_04075 [Bacilli bacterium]|nr:hypothetical protein [Bacilli bacterium]
MDKTLISNVDNKSVYLINDDKVPFYVSIPVNKEVSDYTIVINIFGQPDKINPSISNMAMISQEVINIYDSFKDNTVAVVTPIVDGNGIEQVRLSNSEEIFVYMDKVISYLINQSYKVLSSEGFSISKVVKLYNNQLFENFNNWFINKYNGRVILYNDYEKSTVNIQSQRDVVPENVPVVDPEAQMIANRVLDDTSGLDSVKEEEVLPESDVREPGFVSYVLLGVVVVVVTLVILYMLL